MHVLTVLYERLTKDRGRGRYRQVSARWLQCRIHTQAGGAQESCEGLRGGGSAGSSSHSGRDPAAQEPSS